MLASHKIERGNGQYVSMVEPVTQERKQTMKNNLMISEKVS